MTTLIGIDLYSPDRYETGVPWADFALLRVQAPVYKHPDPEVPGGFWAVTRHADVEYVSRHPELFSSYERGTLMQEFDDETLAQTRLLMLNLDPPDHTRLRSLVNRGFTPRTIAKIDGAIGAACASITDAAVARREGDFVSLVAAELPLLVIAELLGVPVADRQRIYAWSNEMIGFDDPEFQTTPERAKQASIEMFMYANELGAAKRGCPVDDIVSKLVTPDADGNELSELEFDLFFLLLVVAGNETTRNALSGGVLAFAEHPDQWDRLVADPSLSMTAAEEIVRWVSPVVHMRRTATRDVELGGSQILAGDKVVVFYPSANRDEAVFTDPDTFDIGRSPNPHLGFGGGGPHYCLGKHLAVVEIARMLEALVERVERVELTAPVRRLRSNFVNGIKEMPVRFVPRR